MTDEAIQLFDTEMLVVGFIPQAHYSTIARQQEQYQMYSSLRRSLYLSHMARNL